MNHLGDHVEKLYSHTVHSIKQKQSSEGKDELSDLDPSKSGGGGLVSDPAHLGSTPIEAASGPSGHHEESLHRSAGFGKVYTTITPPPVIGADHAKITHSNAMHSDDTASRDQHMIALLKSAMPNVAFPQFDGTNLRLWIKNYENYFEVYLVESYLWVRIATMNLSGSTSLWLQTVQPSIYSWSWSDFVAIVCARFDRDEHNHLIIQFFHVRQLFDVTKYVELFSDITHQILAHDPNLAPSVITNRFIDGLKKEIKAVVMVHRP